MINKKGGIFETDLRSERRLRRKSLAELSFMLGGCSTEKRSINKDAIILDDDESSYDGAEGFVDHSVASLSMAEKGDENENTINEQFNDGSLGLHPVVRKYSSVGGDKEALSDALVEACRVDEEISLNCRDKFSEADDNYMKFVTCTTKDSDGYVKLWLTEKDGGYVNDNTAAMATYEVVPVADNNDDVDDVKDPHYKMFLANLREYGKSYALKIVEDNGTPKLLKYEQQDGSCNGFRFRTAALEKHGSGQLQDHYPGMLCDSADKDYKEFLEPFGKDGHKVDSATEIVDESYKIFIESFGQDGHMVDSATEHGRMVACKENELDMEISSDSEVLIMDMDTYFDGEHTPFITSKQYVFSLNEDGSEVAAVGNIHSQFREKLLILLAKPYSQQEYEDLLQKITEKKPKELERRLRGRVVSYKVDQLSRSYLDHHSDLAARIEMAKGDRRKVLSFLRGFFYWLKNTAQEGSFRPWLDSSCINVLPQQ